MLRIIDIYKTSVWCSFLYFIILKNISVKHSDDHLQLTLQINDYKSWLVFDENQLEWRSLLIGFIRIWILKPINFCVAPRGFPSRIFGSLFLPSVEKRTAKSLLLQSFLCLGWFHLPLGVQLDDIEFPMLRSLFDSRNYSHVSKSLGVTSWTDRDNLSSVPCHQSWPIFQPSNLVGAR